MDFHTRVSRSFSVCLPLGASSSKVQPHVVSTYFKSQLIKSHIINTLLLTSVLLCVCVCVGIHISNIHPTELERCLLLPAKDIKQ